MAAANSQPAIDPEVRERVSAGRTRVLVELRVPEPPASTRDQAEAIAVAQGALIARLAGHDVAVVRRYATIPYVALEIDAAALAALEQMGDLVVRVILDVPLRPSR